VGRPWFVLGALACAAASFAAAAAAQQDRESAAVRAKLEYTKQGDAYRNVRLIVRRDGRVDLRASIARRPAPYWRPVGQPIVRDLEADGEPEVIVEVFTGGAHCCTKSHVFIRSAAGRWARLIHDWGNPGYRLRDLDRDGTVELVTGDDRFSYAFTACVASSRPVQVWGVRGDRLRDVTREHLPAVRTDAAAQWRLYLRVKRDRLPDVRGVLAAWMADKALLGESASGWRALEAARRRGELGRGRLLFGLPAGREYLTKLRAFLTRTGYLS
jgi:hypothetical protein